MIYSVSTGRGSFCARFDKEAISRHHFIGLAYFVSSLLMPRGDCSSMSAMKEARATKRDTLRAERCCD